MTDRPRWRTTNGKQQPRSDFYCKYGSHYVIPLAFEREENNKGICLDCSFEIYQLMRGRMQLPTITPKDEIRIRREWQADMETADATAKLRNGSNDPGWVYYIGQADLIKIGYAVDVTKRIRAYGPTAELLAVHPGTPELEKQMHTKFKTALHRGREWFRRDEDLMNHIESVRTRFGEPTIFEHKWSRPRTQEEKVRAMFDTPEFPVIAQGAHYAGR